MIKLKSKGNLIVVLIIYIIIASGLFFYAHSTKITQCSVDNQSIEILPFKKAYEGKKTYQFKCKIESNIEYQKKFSVVIDDKIESILWNNQNVNLTLIKEQYQQKELLDYLSGYQFTFDIKKENLITIYGTNFGGDIFFNIVQGITILEYLMLFFFIILPILYLFYFLFFEILTKNYKYDLNRILCEKTAVFVMIFFAIIIRVYFLFSVENDMFQHDYAGHFDSIIYFAQYPFSLPQVDKSLQFPQQNLYYLISGAIYNISTFTFHFDEKTTFFIIRSVSVLYSIIFLIIGYQLIKVITQKGLSQIIFIGYIGFTPSLVFMSQRVNNDSLNMLLGIASILCIVLYYKKPSFQGFFITLYIIALAVLTKISSLLFAIVLFIVLLIHFVKFKNHKLKNTIKTRFFSFGVIICFIFGLALIRVYIPALHEFRFVNSTLYLGQVIPSLDLSYFFSFNIFDLIKEGQSYVFGKDEIRFSFLTYQYGTMLTGEYNYEYFFKAGTIIKLLTQMIYVMALIYVIGLLYYIYSFRRLNFIQKMMMVFVIINLGLIIKFIFSYWSICNSDFRYYSPTFGAIGVIFTLGLERLKVDYPKTNQIIMYGLSLLYCVEFFWLLNMGILF